MKRDNPQSTKVTDEQVIAEVTDHLDQSVDALTPDVRQRLHTARKQALAQVERARHATTVGRAPTARLNWQNLWRPLAPIATAAAFATVIFYINVATTGPGIGPNWEQDADLLFSNDDFELYEDLEFYAWLAEVENG